MAADIRVNIEPTGANAFAESFRFEALVRAVFNTTAAPQDVEIFDKFIRNLGPQSKARLRPASDGTGLAYVVPAEPPEADESEGDPGAYRVFMLEGKLILANTCKLTGAFRMKFSENCLQIGMQALMDFSVFGQVSAAGVIKVRELPVKFKTICS